MLNGFRVIVQAWRKNFRTRRFTPSIFPEEALVGENANKVGPSERVHFKRRLLENLNERFDVIVANFLISPWKNDNCLREVLHDPEVALFQGAGES
jgi:methylase of polypeptide subunit release factors